MIKVGKRDSFLLEYIAAIANPYISNWQLDKDDG